MEKYSYIDHTEDPVFAGMTVWIAYHKGPVTLLKDVYIREDSPRWKWIFETDKGIFELDADDSVRLTESGLIE